MRILVVGKGGREHAIVRALALSPQSNEIHAVPGNPGMQKEAVCHNLSTSDREGLKTLVAQKHIDLVVIGPEAELVEGLADFFRQLGVAVFGPSEAASELEASKVFAKDFMNKAGIPTAGSVVVKTVEATMSAAQAHSAPYVLKADGLAAGKGVFVCKDLDELKLAATDLFENKKLGTAGESALLEQNLDGWELSLLCLTNGESYQLLPLAQDHKRLGEGQTGPNTGGMGTVAPLNVDQALMEEIENLIVKPTVAELGRQQMVYRGVIFIGIMVTRDGPKVLEYNVRFGDPETQVVMPLLEGDWCEVLASVANGEMPITEWKPLHTACVVMAAEGYPDSPVKGVAISGDMNGSTPSSYFLHAGTDKNADKEWVTNGGRVLNSVGLGSSRQEALDNAYKQAQFVEWPGMQLRKDIGQSVP
ncbi:MAG: phosphoribosylamine--glycine ligase [Bdellovibrionales bacterium]|nr:phosphoribosylamine--glycine ligase [Bdellovibrionales bacterium]